MKMMFDPNRMANEATARVAKAIYDRAKSSAEGRLDAYVGAFDTETILDGRFNLSELAAAAMAEASKVLAEDRC